MKDELGDPVVSVPTVNVPEMEVSPLLQTSHVQVAKSVIVYRTARLQQSIVYLFRHDGTCIEVGAPVLGKSGVCDKRDVAPGKAERGVTIPIVRGILGGCHAPLLL
jgi:hypothetical protein